MRLMLAVTALAPLCITPLLGCEPIDVPFDLETPPQEVNVDTAVAEAEGSACTAPDSIGCLGIQAWCAAENGGTPCAEPTLPPSFTKEVDIGGTVYNYEDILADAGVDSASNPKAALPIDIAEQLGEAGVDTSKIKAIEVSAIALNWGDNSITFDAPILDLFVGDPTDSADADELVTSGAVAKIGSIGLDTDDDGVLDVGQLAGQSGPVSIKFDEGGNEALNEKVKNFAFVMVARVPDSEGISLKEDPADATKVLKPAGRSDLSIKATFIYKLDVLDTLATASAAAQEAAQ